MAIRFYSDGDAQSFYPSTVFECVQAPVAWRSMRHARLTAVVKTKRILNEAMVTSTCGIAIVYHTISRLRPYTTWDTLWNVNVFVFDDLKIM